METTDGNKLALAVLATLLGTMALGIFSNAIYAPNRALKPGYPLPGASEAAPTAAPAAPETPFPVELAKADVGKGQADTKICQTCHSFEKGGTAKVGPPLYGVVGRPKGSIPGFAYSDGMKSKGGDWTYDDLNQFLTKPSAFVPGTKMTFAGESEESKRADIVDYLHTLSDNPVPLPTPAAATPAPAASAVPAPPPIVTPAPATSAAPSPKPSAAPAPTATPALAPSAASSPTPSAAPSPSPSAAPSPTPSAAPPSPAPSVEPSPTPSAPSPTPSAAPSPTPSVEPSPTPTETPVPTPSETPAPK
jgi:cytochrome c